MRKLLALALVLGLASMASGTAVAGLMLSVNGEPAPDEIGLDVPLQESDSLILDVHVTDGTELAGFVLIVQVADGPGSLDGQNVVFEQSPLTRQFTTFQGIGWYEDPRGWGSGDVAVAVNTPEALRFSAGNTDYNTLGAYTLMDGLMFHCDGEGPVLVELIAIDSTYYTHDAEGGVVDVLQLYDSGAVIDSIIIHQIPEPMTLSLLGLGGLALLRRRR